mmetsp:Transcript_49427/g.73527  ORF Transcript_49427/g.73527 Transcript_49427/m.73527 type:complete len:358 (-) Transcript_49427:54-1127(-)|eukprot:CAMPEP_0195512380 /NCGR_PEP_ID=MMETSP0794_2-20130614/4361_1 /TAXON_ID=515487 /ORGANISM="Stephanopyxis turris, Strain CCMP 815" /LENGTH=357 /DNA_ID=CAMNT_0040640153 /DNA_START=52 /DNA_END=1125 /DNA_ORIENTATION=-
MFSRNAATAAKSAVRAISSTSASNARVTVIGGAGGIGQPLSMLLKMNPLVTHVSVLDLVGAPGVAADLSHINTAASVSGHGMTLAEFNEFDDDQKAAAQAEASDAALKDADIVVIPAGVPRKPGMTRQDLFTVNASLNADFADAVAKNCPNAQVAIISNPVNSTVPIFAEVLKKHGVYDKKRVFGVTTLDIVRANTFVSEAAGVSVDDINVPVVGGHAGASILPLISQATPSVTDKLTQEQIEALTDRIQNGGTEVVNAKAGAGSATLSMGMAGAKFVSSLIRANNGEEGIVECAYIESDTTDLQWFATPLELGKGGWKKNLGLGELSEYEQKMLEAAKVELAPSIAEGLEFAANRD